MVQQQLLLTQQHNANVMADLGLDGTDGWQQYDDQPSNDWISVFGTERSMIIKGVSDCVACSEEWLPLFGDEVLGSNGWSLCIHSSSRWWIR